MSFEAYAARLFDPDPEIDRLAKTIRGVANAYQDFKHIRCDIYRGVVSVDPSLPAEWYDVIRCSPGVQPYRG